MALDSNGAATAVLRAALERALAGRAVGWAFQLRRKGEVVGTVYGGYARAPWEAAWPGIPVSLGHRFHLASMTKVITLAAMGCVLDDWARVRADPSFRPVPLPSQPGSPLSDMDCVNIATRVSAAPGRRFVTPAFVAKVSRCRVAVDLTTPFVQLLAPPFSNVLAALPVRGTGVDAVTIDQLATHRSGFDFSVTMYGDEDADTFYPAAFLNELLPRNIDHGKDGYQNYNSTLLRFLVEGLSGISFSEYVHKRVLLPAGVRRASFDLRDDPPEARVLAYGMNYAPAVDKPLTGLRPGVEPHNAYYSNGGAGGMWASVDELNVWMQDLLSGSSNVFPGPGTMRDQVIQRFNATNGGAVGGDNPPSAPWYGFSAKAGGALGFCGCMAIVPGEQLSAALTINNDGFDANGILVAALSALAPTVTVPGPYRADTLVSITNPLGMGTVRWAPGTGSPTASSGIYTAPFAVSGSGDLRAGVYDGATLISAIGAAHHDSAGAQAPASAGPAGRTSGVAYRVISRADGLSGVKPLHPAVLEALVATGVRTGTTTALDLAFGPGVANNFIVVFGGWLNVATGQTFDFSITSDDGSVLWIDNRLVLDNDGLHSTKAVTASFGLAAGDHRVLLAYFQGGGGTALAVSYGTHGGPLSALGAALTTD